MGVQFSISDKLHGEHKMGDIVLVYLQDKTSFYKLLHLRVFFFSKKWQRYSEW